MEENANYIELKETTKTFLQVITSDKLYYGLFLVVLMVAAIKVVDLIFLPMRRHGRVMASFIKACLKVAIVIAFGLRIMSLVPVLDDLTSQLFLSSSLIVVVMGFVFQEGLSNIVHGFILSVFHPFEIGDRVTAMVDGEQITGYIREITARHTVIQNVMNSAHVVVPNAKMDMCVVVNSYFDKNASSTAFLDVLLTYESDVDLARTVIAETIEGHPYVREERERKHVETPVNVMVRELGENGICLRAQVMTNTVEENFAA